MKVRQRLRGRTGVLVVGALVAPLTVTATTAGSAAARAATTAVTAAPAAAPGPVPSVFARQVLVWERCYPDDSEIAKAFPVAKLLDCSSFKAPLDWAKPATSGSITVAVSRVKATTQPARAATFTNPGGPGAPGLTLPISFVINKRTALLATQDVYGIDPRGAGASTNATCGNTAEATLEYRDRSAANLELILDQVEVSARVCDVKGRALLDQVTTPNTVRDLDLFRQLIGRSTINWIGYSGGTWLGAQYATTFPRRTGRFVLDANTEFTADFQKVFQENQPPAFERRFRVDFLGWLARYDDVFGWGNTPEKARQSYERLRAALRRDPLTVEGYPFEFDGPVLDGLIRGNLYVKRQFQGLAELLVDLRTLSSAAPTARAATGARQRLLRSPDVRDALNGKADQLPPLSADNEGATFLGIICNDTPWKGDRAYLIKRSADLGRRYPLAGYGVINSPCVFWNRPRVTLPKVTGKRLPPMLMVQTVRDPATSYEGAVRASKATTGTRLLTVTNEGDHGTYGSDNECVNVAVERFINTGVLPAKGATCAGVGLPAYVPPAPAAGGPPEGQGGARSNVLDLTERLARLAGGSRR